MNTQPAIQETIKRRFSCRSYEKRSLDSRDQRRLSDFCAGRTIGPLGNRARFMLVHNSPGDSTELKGLGTYGMIQGAQAFVIGAIDAGPQAPEDFGYLMEEIILESTAMELGTCWLGGSFSRGNFAKKMALKENELLPAVTPVGYIPDKPRLLDRIIRRAAGSDNREPWEKLFSNEKFSQPLSKTAAGAYAEVLEMVRIGPSASNKQPWRIVRQGRRWHFYLQHNPAYLRQMQLAKIIDLQRVDMGIGMCHFALSAQALGLKGQWQIQDPGLEKSDPNQEYSVTWLEA